MEMAKMGKAPQTKSKLIQQCTEKIKKLNNMLWP